METDKVGRKMIWISIIITAYLAYIFIAVADLYAIFKGDSIIVPLISFALLMVMLVVDNKAAAHGMQNQWKEASRVCRINDMIYYASIASMLVGLYINFGGS